jgi:hypothetical protein
MLKYTRNNWAVVPAGSSLNMKQRELFSIEMYGYGAVSG